MVMDFKEMVCEFLNCSEGSLPFKYLGLPVGANSRRCDTWQPLLDLLNRIGETSSLILAGELCD